MYSQYGLEGKDIPVMHNGAMAQKKSNEEMQKEARETLGLPANSPEFWMQKGNSKQFAHMFSIVPASNLR